jgi:S1-C subfamily serine protease
VGASTYAIGNALGEGLAFTSGMMSVQEDIIKISDLTYTTLFFRTTTPFTKGMSGGGIYNSNAQLIGMVCARHTEFNEINFGMSYSIINALYSRLDEAKNRLISHAKIEFSSNAITVEDKTFVKNGDGFVCSSDTAITAINAVPLTDIKSFTQMCSIILQTPSVSFA